MKEPLRFWNVANEDPCARKPSYKIHGVFVNITENGMIGMWVCVKIRQND